MLGVVGFVLSTTLLYVQAGSCNHGGETSAFHTYKTVAVDCISTGFHPCYVGGELTECETYRYKYLNYTICAICGAEGQAYYSYGPTLHEFVH